jgi:hypothetical protein
VDYMILYIINDYQYLLLVFVIIMIYVVSHKLQSNFATNNIEDIVLHYPLKLDDSYIYL